MSQQGVFFSAAILNAVDTLTGNVGGPIAAVAHNINVVGAGLVTVTGAGNTLTISFAGGGLLSSARSDLGAGFDAVPSVGILNFLGGTNINTSSPGGAPGNTLTINLDDTISLAGSVTAGTFITATAGNIQATAGWIGTVNNDVYAGRTSNDALGSSFIASKEHGAGTIVQNADTLGNVIFMGFDGAAQQPGAYISSKVTAVPGAGKMPSELTFWTSPNAVSVPLKRITIASTGEVTIAAPDSGTGLTVSSGITATTGNIAASAGSVSASTTVTAGTNLVSTAGDLLLASTNSNRTVGAIKVGSNPVIHFYRSRNTFVGELSGGVVNFEPATVDCTAIGYSALNNLQVGTTPIAHTLIGSYSGRLIYNNCTGTTAVGFQTAYNTGTLNYATLIGYQAGYTGYIGDYSTCIGYQAGNGYTSGTCSHNILINAPGVATDSHKLRIGAGSGTGTQQLNDAWISGLYTPTTAIGATAKVMLIDSNDHLGGLANTTGAVLHVAAAGTAPIWSTGPTISGTLTANALAATTTVTAGTNLVSTAGNLLLPTTSSTVGQIQINSLRQLHAYGTYNTFVGEEAGNFTLTSTNCTTLGYRAGYSLTSGSYNNLIGFACGTALTTGGYNNGQGRGCLNRLTAGNYNCAMGFEAGYYLSSTASYNTVIGNSSGPSGNANVNYCTYLGYSTGSSQADTNSSNVYIRNVGANESHKIRIGTTGSSDGQQNDTWIAGTYTPTTAIGGTAKVMLVDSNDHLGGLANTTGAVLHVAAAGTAPIWSTGPTITDLVLTGTLTLPSTEITADTYNLTINKSFVVNNANLSTLQLPGTAAVGSWIRVVGKSANMWKIDSTAAKNMHEAASSTSGAGGGVAANERYTSITLQCITADADWVIVSKTGTVTIS